MPAGGGTWPCSEVRRSSRAPCPGVSSGCSRVLALTAVETAVPFPNTRTLGEALGVGPEAVALASAPAIAVCDGASLRPLRVSHRPGSEQRGGFGSSLLR